MSIFPKTIEAGEDMFADVEEALQTVRAHLGMDMSYLTEVQGEDVVFRAVSRAAGKAMFVTGDRMPFEHTLCKHILAGDLPNLISDLNDLPPLQLASKQAGIPIRSHISVPIRRTTGEVYGMFCCSSLKPNTSLNARDLNIVTMFAALAAKSLNQHLDIAEHRANLRRQVTDMMQGEKMTVHLQPIVSLRSGEVRAFEALSRFSSPRNGISAPSTVEAWFEQARTADLQVPFELNAIRLALPNLPLLPPKVYLSVNVSPATLSSPKFREALDHVPPNRIFVELTEHVQIAETPALLNQLNWLRSRGIGIAIDDVGAGYAGLSTIIKLRPNVIKLDRSLVRDIDLDPAKQSLVQALFHFAEQVEAYMIAEGVERVDEHRVLAGLGARLGQGYLYGRPGPADQVIAAAQNGSALPLPS
jgi:EAL domain-containing protein (putative c-di-GMP-specific phosphodiesterase class I)